MVIPRAVLTAASAWVCVYLPEAVSPCTIVVSGFTTVEPAGALISAWNDRPVEVSIPPVTSKA